MLSTKLVEDPNQVALRPRKQTIQSTVAMQMQLCKDMQQEPFFITIRRFVKPEPAEATISVTCSNSEPMANQGSGNSMFFFFQSFPPRLLFFAKKISRNTLVNHAIQYPSRWLETKPHPTVINIIGSIALSLGPWKGNHTLIDLDTTEVDPHTS